MIECRNKIICDGIVGEAPLSTWSKVGSCRSQRRRLPPLIVVVIFIAVPPRRIIAPRPILHDAQRRQQVGDDPQRFLRQPNLIELAGIDALQRVAPGTLADDPGGGRRTGAAPAHARAGYDAADAAGVARFGLDALGDLGDDLLLGGVGRRTAAAAPPLAPAPPRSRLAGRS